MAYFYINTDGSVVVRKSDDYIPTMIEIAGGRYVFKDLKNSEGNAPSVKLTMEEFYATAVDADYLIYNQGGIDKFTFDKDGKPVGVDDILKPLREDKTY